MSDEKRYSVWGDVKYAIECGPDYGTWHDAKVKMDALWEDRFDQWRIWDHSTNPPTDVTDADPEAVKKPEPWVRYVKQGITSRCAAYFAGSDSAGVSKTPPTDGSPYYRVTVERIEPEPEEPQWHYWNPYGWQRPESKPLRAYVHFDGYDYSGQVWGTTSDRDAKRDALLAAAKAAGKPS